MNGNNVYIRPAFSQNVLAYNTTTDSWSKLQECPTKFCCIAVVNNLLTAIGGELCGKTTNKLFTLPEESSNWVEKFPPMPTPQKSKFAVSCGEEFLIVAGNALSSGTDFAVMNTTSLSWSKVACIPYFCWLHSLVACREKLYCIFGDGNMYQCSIEHLVLSIGLSTKKTKIWKKLPYCDDLLSESAFVTVGTQFLSIGGKDSFAGINTAEVRMYCPSTNTWKVINRMTTPRRKCFAAVLPNNTLIVIGGYTTIYDNSMTDKVEIATIIL